MINLVRQDVPSSFGSPGKILLNDVTYYTMEQPDLGNTPFKSCVPQGEYDLIPYDSPTYGKLFCLLNEDLNVYMFEDSPGRPVNGRYLCLAFHPGNYPSNFEGCIGAGESYNTSLDMITKTKETCKKLLKAVEEEGSYKLAISFVWG